MTNANQSVTPVLRVVKKWPLTVFTLLTLIVTYPVGIAALIALQPLQDLLPVWVRDDFITGFVSRFAPTLVGFLMMALLAGTPAFSVWLKQLTRWRLPVGHYVFMFTSVLVLWTLSILVTTMAIDTSIPQILGPDMSVFERLLDYASEILYVTVTNGEETGWRFVLLGILLTRMRLFSATLISGLLWALWHLPIMLLSTDGISLFLPFFCLVIALSIVMSWLYKSTNSLWAVLLYHGIFNATSEYAYERQFPALSESLASHEIFTTWIYAIGFSILALTILLSQKRLFFGPDETPVSERWSTFAPQST